LLFENDSISTYVHATTTHAKARLQNRKDGNKEKFDYKRQEEHGGNKISRRTREKV
jgi:hypothetical protein